MSIGTFRAVKGEGKRAALICSVKEIPLSRGLCGKCLEKSHLCTALDSHIGLNPVGYIYKS